MSYSEFIARETDLEASGCRADGLKPGGCGEPAPYNAFEWTDDGCSGADQIGPLFNVYRNLFSKPYQVHDFGYRNLGKGITHQRIEIKGAEAD